METKEQFLMEWDTIGLMIEYCFSSNGWAIGWAIVEFPLIRQH
jgi:hypothetical protein